MKICIWVTKIFEMGGTKRVVTLLANELVKEHDVTIMCYQDRFKEDRTMFHMSEDIKVDFIENSEFVNRHWTPSFLEHFLVKKLNKRGYFNKKRWNHLLADALFPKETQDKWVEYLNEKNYDVIITTASLSLRLGMIADRLNAKTIGWQHNCYDGYVHVPNVVFWKQESLLQEYLPKLDRYIVLSEYDRRDYMEKLGIDTEVKINPRSFVSAEKCDPGAKRFLMATRFVYAKGLDLMMESFEEFCKQDSEWDLDILGDGDLFKEIVADAKKRGLTDRVHFVGYTKEPEKYYLSSSVFLLPSRWEGWPMVIMEAFEFGLPVIAFHTGAMDLIIDDGKTGLLPEAFDTHKFTQAMLRLAHDEELRLAMHKNAIEKSGDFAIEKAVAEWNGLFQRLTGKTPPENKPPKPDYEEELAAAKRACRLSLNEELRAKYARFLETEPILEKTILYESFAGRGMTCSPYAIFRYLLEQPDFADYTHVWALDDFDDNRWQLRRYEGRPNVRFVRRQSEEYRRYLASAKYLINNVGFPGYFTKREGQIYVDTWHGIPLKTLGFDIPGGNLSNGNSAKNLLAADYIISPNAFMTQIYRKSFKLEGLYAGTILEEGQPRNDRYFHTKREEILEKLRESGVDADPDKKIILYAPTWKGGKYSSPDTSLDVYEEILRRIGRSVDPDRYQVFVKPHQIVYYHIKKTLGVSGRYIPATVDTNELLSVTDVLISDYSSIYFDFLVSGKPILFFIPDLEEYQGTRGLYYGVEKLPGPVAKTYEELENLVRDPEKAMEPLREKYAAEAAWACPGDDGKVCARVVDAVFRGKTAAHAIKCGETAKKRLLLYPGRLLSCGRTFSFLELAGRLDYDKYDVTVLAEEAQEPLEEERIRNLPPAMRVLYRGQPANGTPKEQALAAFAMKWAALEKEAPETESPDLPEGADEALSRYFCRELRRLFGESRFDYAVDLCGGNGPLSGMLSELAGCASAVFEGEFLNEARLRGREEDGCLAAPGGNLSVLDARPGNGILTLDVISAPDPARKNYAAMGALTKKNRFRQIIKHFAGVRAQEAGAHLYILGDGTERQKLEKLTNRLGLRDAVTFTDFVEHPFGLLGSCSAFVAAPGQGDDNLNILEARALGLPVVAADFTAKAGGALDVQKYNRRMYKSFEAQLKKMQRI